MDLIEQERQVTQGAVYVVDLNALRGSVGRVTNRRLGLLRRPHERRLAAGLRRRR